LVDEPATVTVNGNPAKVMSTAGGAPFKFEAPVDLAVGANTVVVEARDGNNNLATKTYSVTTTGASTNYEYDANGNLRYEKQPNGTVSREYRWDQQNRLVRMLAGGHESVYEYDGQSRRVRITEKESGVQTKQETFVWCGSRICQKRSGSTVVRSYFGQGFEQGSDDCFYTREHLGSVREVVAGDGTTVGSRLSYDPWGTVTETGLVLSDFTYTGHHYDRPTGLSMAWYRGYDPNHGRWLSKDPIGLKGGLNLYGYVNNDPANTTDPLGLYVYHCSRWGTGSASFVRHQYQCVYMAGQIRCFGWGGAEEDDVLAKSKCHRAATSSCTDACMLPQFDDPKNFRRPYNPFTNNCYQWKSRTFEECAKRCQ
jgi:RHS repeat-associated protein